MQLLLQPPAMAIRHAMPAATAVNVNTAITAAPAVNVIRKNKPIKVRHLNR